MFNLSTPLVVDLDGTLARADTLEELLLHAIRQDIRNSSLVFPLVFGNRVQAKAQLSEIVDFDFSSIPLNQSVIRFIDQAHTEGRKVILATASSKSVALSFSERVGGFSEVLYSTNGVNLNGTAKAQALISRFGVGGYDYLGDHRSDIEVMRFARKSIFVEPSRNLMLKARHKGIEPEALGKKHSQAMALLRSMRPHQWAKNILLFLPAIAAQSFEFSTFLVLSTGFLLFSAVSSSVYLTNDVLDVANDRRHEKKRNRPVASGFLPIRIALLSSLLLAGGSIAIAGIWAGFTFALSLVAYVILATAYSTWLKRVPLIDALTLVALYGIRIIAGAVLVSVTLSTWLIGFSLFAFFSLAFLKRFVELQRAPATERSTLLPGRGYQPEDSSMVSLFGVCAGYVGALILALYVEEASESALYSQPSALWGLVPVWALWISRSWLIGSRGNMNDDPVVYALRDPGSLLLGSAGIITLTWAIWGG